MRKKTLLLLSFITLLSCNKQSKKDVKSDAVSSELTKVKLKKRATNLNEAFKNKNTIERLYLENNVYIPDSILLLQNIKSIELRNYNAKEDINPIIFELPKLKSFKIIHSKLSSIHPEIIKAKQIENLTLHSGSFKGIPPEVIQLKKLRRLNMVSNHIESIPDEMKSLKNLKSLDVSGNDFSKKDIEKYKKEYAYLNFQCVDRETMD